MVRVEGVSGDCQAETIEPGIRKNVIKAPRPGEDSLLRKALPPVYLMIQGGVLKIRQEQLRVICSALDLGSGICGIAPGPGLERSLGHDL